MRQLKVLYVADTFLPKRDGVITFMLETIKNFSKNIKVSLLIPEFPGAKYPARKLKLKTYFCPLTFVRINDYPAANPLPRDALKVIDKAIDSADIICLHSIAPLGARVALRCRKFRKPLIEIIHSLDWKLVHIGTHIPIALAPFFRKLARYLYKKPRVLIVMDKRVKQELRNLGVKKKILAIPIGLDVDRFKPDKAAKKAIRKKLGLQMNFVLGYHGRFGKEKNLRLLVKAGELASRQVPNLALLLVGNGLKLKSKKVKLVSTGFVDKPEKYLQAMDLYVLPSKTETTALGLMEAMACGLPCISSRVGAIPSYVKNNFNGILIRPDELNVKRLASEIIRLYKNNRLRDFLASNALKSSGNFASWRDTTIALEKIFVKYSKNVSEIRARRDSNPRPPHLF